MLKCYSYVFLLVYYEIIIWFCYIHFFSVGDDFKVEMLNEWWRWLLFDKGWWGGHFLVRCAGSGSKILFAVRPAITLVLLVVWRMNRMVAVLVMGREQEVTWLLPCSVVWFWSSSTWWPSAKKTVRDGMSFMIKATIDNDNCNASG